MSKLKQVFYTLKPKRFSSTEQQSLVLLHDMISEQWNESIHNPVLRTSEAMSLLSKACGFVREKNITPEELFYLTLYSSLMLSVTYNHQLDKFFSEYILKPKNLSKLHNLKWRENPCNFLFEIANEFENRLSNTDKIYQEVLTTFNPDLHQITQYLQKHIVNISIHKLTILINYLLQDKYQTTLFKSWLSEQEFTYNHNIDKNGQLTLSFLVSLPFGEGKHALFSKEGMTKVRFAINYLRKQGISQVRILKQESL